MKAELEKFGGITLIAETEKERYKLIELYVNRARVVAIEGSGENIVIAPRIISVELENPARLLCPAEVVDFLPTLRKPRSKFNPSVSLKE